MMLPIAFGMSPWDVPIIAVIVLVLFGGPKVGGFMKSLGEGMKEFKKAATDDEPAAAPPAPATAPPVSASAPATKEDK